LRVLSACRYYVFSQFSLQDACLIPCNGNAGNETGRLLFFHVGCRIVAQHDQGVVKDNVGGHLPGACAGRHGIVVYRMEILACCIAHPALCVIDRAGQHSYVRESNIVGDHVFLAPFGLFQSEDALKIHHVRIGAVESRWLVHAMEINQQLVPGRRFCKAIQHLHYRLVVPVHEVDLESPETHLGI